MKIVVLGTRGFPHVQGGVEAHCENLYPQLVEKGHEVIVFTRKPYVDLAISEYKGVTLIPLPCFRNKFLEAFFHTFIGIFAARKISPDILHVHAIGPSLYIPLARFLGLKVVMTNHGPDYKRKKWNILAKAVLKTGERFGSKWANSIICISETIATHVREKYHRYVTVIPNGVIIPQILQSDMMLRKYGLIKRRFLLAVGRFVPEKGFHDLINAFNQLSVQYPYLLTEKWKLVIAGRADHEDSYSAGLKACTQENNNIILTGFVTGKSLQELYSNAGLFVLPSYYEGLPIVLLEALSYGLSCVVSDIPANREVALNNDRFFKVGHVESLVAKIREFINNPLSEAEKTRQISMIREKYNWEKIAAMTMDVYRRVHNGIS
ncbi:MAG: glycosyltransferase family 4 protein [Candidatus Loosdrechtia sp.]|uniref:glycosyltransferase family 4 protein n=1 Tax=Candidatus Loosdrechtia sp. TaxID=3101272 RepID=UPI003A788BAD|nr:MAG: glycosyltransferase family 4 protein [Candidatus Jettenia sp. AMX2]